MSTTWIAELGDAELEVSLGEGPSETTWVLRRDGQEVAIDAVRLPHGAWSLLVGTRSLVVDVVSAGADPGALSVFVDGRDVPLRLEDARARRFAKMVNHAGGGSSKGESLRAPIAGKVVKVLAPVGTEVAVGDPLIVLEAMKMENELRATRPGTVASIAVAAGDSVETGQLLMKLT